MPINIMSAFTEPPPELDFIWDNGLLAGTTGALVAPSGTGKSIFALEIAIAVSCTVAGGDLLAITPRRGGKVFYFSGEEPDTVLIHRIHAIGQHLNLQARDAIAKNFVLESTIGQKMNLMDGQKPKEIIKTCKNARLIVFDTISRMHDLDENSNGDMARLISSLEEIAQATGAAILFLHHISKNSTRDGQADQQQAARGASALIDNARWSGYLSKMTAKEAENKCEQGKNRSIGIHRKKYIRFGVNKQNYKQITSEVWYKQEESGLLLPVNLQDNNNETRNKQTDPKRQRKSF